MPRIVACLPDATVAVDLAGGVYRLALAATNWQTTPCLSLVVRYPSNPAALAVNGSIVPLDSLGVVALARVPVPFANEVGEVAKVAQATLSAGNLAEDRQRMEEGFNLFRNNPRMRADTLAGVITDSTVLLETYWKLRTWLKEGSTAALMCTVPAGEVVGLP